MRFQILWKLPQFQLHCRFFQEHQQYHSHYFYYLIFTDATNKTHRILYNKALFEREMNVLVSRIEHAQG